VPAALQAHELGNILEILAKNVLSAFGENWHGARTKLQEPLSSCGVIGYINGEEVNALFRKKLFRS
jgi:hypothetical protein